MTNRKRIEWIDSLKGLTMLLVVLLHVAESYHNANVYPEYNGLLIFIFHSAISFVMPLFFIISGFLFADAYVTDENELKVDKVKSQAGNLICIYTAYCLAFGASKLVMSSEAIKPLQPLDLLLIYVKAISPYWYIYVLLIYYACWSVKRVRTANHNILLTVLLLVSIVSRSFGLVVNWLELSNATFYAVFFYIGFLLRQNRMTIKTGGSVSAMRTFVFLTGGGYNDCGYGYPIHSGHRHLVCIGCLIPARHRIPAV